LLVQITAIVIVTYFQLQFLFLVCFYTAVEEK